MRNTQPTALITAIATSLPEKILTNIDLEKMVDTSHEWILSRTGIEERRIASSEESTSTLAINASKKVLATRNIPPSDIDLIIVTTMTPDYLCPSTACLVQSEVGAERAGAFDLQAACSGFIYGLNVSKSFIEAGTYQRILLVASEKNSAFVDYTDRNTCILFGDGAAACIIESSACFTTPPKNSLKIRTTQIGAQGSLSDLIIIPAGGSRLPVSEESYKQKLHTLKMNGREVFKHAVRRMEQAAKECLDKENIDEKSLSWLIPHQANIRIIDALAKRFEIPYERVATTIKKYANTSASTIPIALQVVMESGEVKPHDLFLLVAFGGGLTWGASVLEANI